MSLKQRNPSVTETALTKQLVGSDHKVVILTVNFTYSTETIYKIARWNYKQANWNAYRIQTEAYFDARFETTMLEETQKRLQTYPKKLPKKLYPQLEDNYEF